MFQTVTWKRRWFILSGRLLVYTASHKSDTVKRMLDLSRVDVVTDPRDSRNMPRELPTPHAIGLLEVGNPYVLTLCAETHADVLNWYVKIVKNISLLCVSIPAEVKNKRYPPMSLAPKDRTEKSYREKRRASLIAKHKTDLPEVPQPQETWFYPYYELPPSYYDVLGVPPDAPGSVIKKSYYRIAKNSHPDRNPDGLSAPKPGEFDFQQVALAYETLIDPAKREAYDVAERIKESLRRGVDCVMFEAVWSDEDLELPPKDRVLYNVDEKPVTIFCDGELRCVYWQPASADPGVLLPLRPHRDRAVELRFVQMVLFARDSDHLYPSTFPQLPYEHEDKFVVVGDRLHTGVLCFRMPSPQDCADMVAGLRMARCEKSMLFQQKLDKLREAGIR